MTLQHIHTYEMPFETAQLSFQLYEVQGKTIRNEQYPHKTEFPHRHNYYEICIFKNGAGKHEIDFQTYPITSNSVHFLTPGQVHLISREENYHGYLMVFRREFLSPSFHSKDLLFDLPFFNNPGIKPVLELNENDFVEVLQIIDQIKLEIARKDAISHDILKSYIQIFLLKCKYYFIHHYPEHSEKENPSYFLTSKFKNLVEQNFQSLHFVKQYAELLAITSTNLNKTVKKFTGENASDIIIDRIVLESKRLLIYTELTNKEIAYRLNYVDPSYFSRIFKSRTGDSPSGFRSKMKKKYQKK